MKVDRDTLKHNIEDIISSGVVNGEEVDITTSKIMEEIELIIRSAEKWDGKIVGYAE